ncbi:NADPH-dependent 7-cyano-7-deazaguanine reductase QueF [Psychrobacter sp. FDAARGOS_221]|uniref:NADPH-dependent 7-cyano-7-deazaguanine reductase QueF n=1 Tax=Psychrobacter sp. FDAARGOS_221 TaxID=1975705 RepID=UPI000BB577DB|nr:NADPH-dependent 7-cyano-7-deazaguanine reductase QueF [Psychrobacter sp. FDAARGOS_221]PNK60148.1 NADPH-dependent 7-cyano-7-deazaguanine reductase QueF [Psychrobacter sp. FDAARGOS_221]
MSIHGVLGESTSYPKTYQPDTLFAIERALGRDAIGWEHDKLALGMDWWHAFEVSWLTPQGISQVAVARFGIPASSRYIVESKSLKLYLNSLNFTEFDSWQAVEETIAKDLSACVDAQVQVELFELEALTQASGSNSGLLISQPSGQCVDQALQGDEKVELVADPDASLLQPLNSQQPSESSDKQPVQQQFYSNLLRSNCPVTNQPDWGTLSIEMTGAEAVDPASLLRYILSYRQHNGFHEQCVEQVFADLSQRFNPDSLMVRAWYTRRGGIDINPCRVSDESLLPKPSRLVRQ